MVALALGVGLCWTAWTPTAHAYSGTISGGTQTVVAPPEDSYGQEVYADNPFAWWRLDESSGPPVDYMGNTDLTTTGGAPAYRQDPVASNTGTGKSILYDGVDDVHRRASATTLVSQTAFALEAWVRPGANMRSPTYQPGTPVGKVDASGATDQYGLDLSSVNPTNRNQFGFYIRQTGPPIYASVHGGSIDAAGDAVHIAMTWEGSTLRGYVNGTEVGSVASTGPLAARNAASFNIGGEVNTKFFQGRIDEVAYYNSALPDARVRAHYLAGAPPPTLDLGAKKQKLRKNLVFFATANFNSTLVAGGSVKQTTVQLAGNEKTKVKAKLKRAKRKKFAKKLAKSSKAKAKVEATATDQSGATATDAVKVKLED